MTTGESQPTQPSLEDDFLAGSRIEVGADGVERRIVTSTLSVHTAEGETTPLFTHLQAYQLPPDTPEV